MSQIKTCACPIAARSRQAGLKNDLPSRSSPTTLDFDSIAKQNGAQVGFKPHLLFKSLTAEVLDLSAGVGSSCSRLSLLGAEMKAFGSASRSRRV